MRPHWRKMTWVLLLWCAAIIAWAVAGGAQANCTGTYASACQAGTGIGIAIILLIGFVGFVFFSLIWFMSRPKGRVCPACGETAKRGVTVCRSCHFDFAAAAKGAPAPAPAA
jgi:hypothetical protein